MNTGTPAVYELSPRGPISGSVIDRLSGAPGLDRFQSFASEVLNEPEDPCGDDDFQLAQYVLHEIDYRSLPGIDDDWEVDSGLIQFRGALDAAFLASVRDAVGTFEVVAPEDVAGELSRLAQEHESPSLSRFVESSATLDQVRELMVHRSLHQLKAGDPHAWVIPRLSGRPRAAVVEVQADERSKSFATAMTTADLNPSENLYLDQIPGITMACVNLMSALGKRRCRRGAIVGHLAMLEMISPTASYDHAEADSARGNVAAFDLAQGLALMESELTEDIQFGARAMIHLEARFAEYVLERWDSGLSSLPNRAESTTHVTAPGHQRSEILDAPGR